MAEGAPSTDKRARIVGKTIRGRWFLEGLLGSGGVGAVYAATDLASGAKAAVKVIDAEGTAVPEVVARFEREARIVAGIDSPFVVRVLDTGSDAAGRPFLAMERLEGEDLGRRLSRVGRLRAGELAPFVHDVLVGLAAAHARGVVHRDLKPDNVFLVVRDGRAWGKLLDFGTSRLDRPTDRTAPLSLTGRGKIVGTPHYLAPEQARGDADVDARADLYAVGAIVYECLAGRPPHTGKNWADVVVAATTLDPPDVRTLAPDVEPEVAAFVRRALARDRAARFASADAMREALRDVFPELASRPAPAAATGSSSSARLVATAPTQLSAGPSLAPADRRGPPVRVVFVRARASAPWLTWAVAGVALALGAASAWATVLWLGR